MKKLSAILLTVLIAVAFITAFPAKTQVKADSFNGFRTVYRPETGIISPPAIVAEIKTKNQYSALKAEKTPAFAIYHIDDGLTLILDGKSANVSLYEAINSNPNIIPVIYVKNQTQADGLKKFVSENSLVDAYVMSDKPELVSNVRKTCISILGAIDLRSTKLNKDKPIEIRSLCQKNNAKIALLSSLQGTHETVDYLRHRVQNVWIDGNDNAVNAFGAAAAGASGIVYGSFEMGIELLESFTERTMLKTPLLIGHTGDRTHSENTIGSAVSALNKGADGVECDIQITADNKVVLMHDTTLDRTTNGTGNIDRMTLEEIQQYTVKNSNEKVPSFDDYLAELKGKNCVIYVEFKYSQPQIIPLVKELLEKHDMYDQVIFITFHEAVLKELRVQIPEIPTSFLSGDLSVNTAYTYAGLYNCDFSPNYTGTDAEKVFFLQSRGINVNDYTYNNLDIFKKKYTENHASMTADYPTYALTYEAYADGLMEQYNVFTDENRAYTVSGATFNRIGDERGVSSGYIYIDGNIELNKTGAGETYGSGDGYAYISFYGECGELGYRVYSKPVPVISGTGKLPEPDSSMPDNPPDSSIQGGGCNGCGGNVSALLAVLLCILPLIKKY